MQVTKGGVVRAKLQPELDSIRSYVSSVVTSETRGWAQSPAADFTRKHGKPLLHLHPEIETPRQELAGFNSDERPQGFERGRSPALR
jgi:hypothetical protein